MEKVKFYNTLWFAWLCMWIFPLQPLAIYLFIKNKHHKKLVRYGACIVFGLAFIQVLGFNLGRKESVDQVPESNIAYEKPADDIHTTQQDGSQTELGDNEEVPDQTEAEQPVQEEVSNEATIKESEIHFIDTGNSDAILIMNDSKAMLVDGGDNDDETLIVNYLKNQGITELEYVIATHPHADHVGGLDAVLSNLKVKNVFIANGDADTKTYRDFVSAAMNKGVAPSVPLEGKKFPLGSSYFTVMNTNGGDDTNNQSLVVEYVNGKDKILLMGDAETEVENEILSQVGQVDLLKLGHHGSRSSTSQAFLDKVNPKYGIITAGTNNQYGHPHQEVVSRLEGIEVHRTDECGNIIFKSTGDGLNTGCEVGSLKAGLKKEETSTVNNKPSTGNTSGSGGGMNLAPKPVEEQSEPNNAVTVYWTPNGKSYHTTKSCSTLSRSKVIHSGTIAESGKNDPCDRCH